MFTGQREDPPLETLLLMQFQDNPNIPPALARDVVDVTLGAGQLMAGAAILAPKTTIPVAPSNAPTEGAQPRTVFRGERSSRTPVKVFEEGIPPKGTNADLEAHVAANLKDSNFVATSIRPAIAKGFAGKNGYVHVIRTQNGIHVNATLGAKSPFPEQFEVAIPGGVSNSEVMGAFPMKNGEIAGEFIRNPNYKPPQ